MNDTIRLSPTPPARVSMNYAALRESGMELIRQLASETWTDHNLHDPGITLLEAFCYAMTELGFRIQLDMPDLLRSGEVSGLPNLVPAHRILPSAPVTSEDLQKVLLDHPLLREAQIKLEAESEVAFYENLTTDSETDGLPPPFTYEPTTSRVHLRGIYEVMVEFEDLEFEDSEWNSNTYTLSVKVEQEGLDGQDYLLEVALPYWDEPEVELLRNGLIDPDNINVFMEQIGSNFWRTLAEPQTYFGRLYVSDYDLELMSINSLDELPTAGNSLVIVARIDTGDVFHVLIFDRIGNRVVNREFSPDEMLLSQLAEALSNQPIDNRTKSELIRKIAFSLNYSDAGLALWIVLQIIDDLEQPTTEEPAILEAAREQVETTDEGSLIGKFIERVRSAYGGAIQLQRYVDSWRNLCEVPVRLQVARQQEIALRARIEVTGSTDLEQLLADIFLAIDLALSPPRQFYSLAEMDKQGKTPENLYEGPLLLHGFLSEGSAKSLADSGKIYTSDILRIIMRRRSSAETDVVTQENPTGRDIVAVTDLALSNFVNNRPITTDAKDCLNLVEIERYRPRLSITKSRINFVRNDLEVSYDLRRVEELFNSRQLQYRGSTRNQEFSPLWSVQQGESLPVDDYYGFPNDLPRIYGVGEVGVPESAGKEAKARSLQTKGYLLLFEQFLADLTAQLGHINNFFSGDPEEQATYFTRALFDVLGTERLLKGFSGNRDLAWENYLVDPNNSYRQALRAAVESPAQFLDRRNRMLDHLLARQGEETVTWAQELHRWAQKSLMEANLPPDELLAAMEVRRQGVNRLLIRDKADFLGAAPNLNATKFQGFGHPLRRYPELLQLEQTAEGFHWLLILDGEPRLRSGASFSTQGAAIIGAEEAFVLAAQSNFYQVVSAGAGRYRYQLTDPADTSTPVVGESIETWTTEGAAENALTTTAELFAALRLEASLTSMERRIAYLTGIRSQKRRRLSIPIDAFFEIYDEVDEDEEIEKRWRLWELPDYSGQVLLSSVFHFDSDTNDEEEAIALARASIEQVLRYGLDQWNYHISPAGEETFNFELRHPDGTKLGRYNPPLPSEVEALKAIHKTIEQLYSLYSAEGFHLVEHILLRPRSGLNPLLTDGDGSEESNQGDVFLELPSTQSEPGWERDPYSHRLSLIFPSGYARDFSTGASNSDTRRDAPPHRFRELEFRHHVERIVQQACPAHLLPTVYWVDRQDPYIPFEFPDLLGENAEEICFDHFEEIYFTWLDTQLIPEIADNEVNSTRNQLTQALNVLPSSVTIKSLNGGNNND